MATIRGLRELARCYGLQTSYEDVTGQRRQASQEALLGGLKVMGAPVASPGDVPAALEQFRAAERSRVLEPVLVAWNGKLNDVAVRIPPGAGGGVTARLRLEEGSVQEWQWSADQLPPAVAKAPAGQDAPLRRLMLHAAIPFGYHRLEVTVGGRIEEALLISAPRRIDAGPLASSRREWGLFAPVYAIHSEAGWGAGSVSEFSEFARWVRQLGGSLVASLPLLASFFDNPDDASPYSPASRLFWNELYVDVTRAPEFAACPEAQRRAASPDFQQALADARRQELVDARRVMRLKRDLLEPMSAMLFASSSSRRTAFESFARENRELPRYAKFRAICERLGRPWNRWPSRAIDGELPDDPADRDPEQYHLYAQWLAHEQLTELSHSAHAGGMTWYLDVPLGTHPDGFDVWRFRSVFAQGAAGGAPPDAFFTQGQNWGFPPLHPHRLRSERYEYLIQVFRHHLQQARLLRLDHVMGLHRLYWVPDGMPATQGVYVRYPAEELYAIVLLEAHRLGASIIGENLGTVPSYVNRSMRTHRLGRLYVFQYEMNAALQSPTFRAPDPDEVASLNTHDMPTFASWWQGHDIDDRLDLRLMSPAEASAERAARDLLRQRIAERLHLSGHLPEITLDSAPVLRACLKWLASSQAPVVLVNVEDLWLELQPQNTPGTVSERINWRKKAQRTLEELRASREFGELLRELADTRRDGG